MASFNPLTAVAEAGRDRALAGRLPAEATEGTYALGTVIMVSREAISEKIRNPDLPEWFPAVVCMPPSGEAGNWYRWYDPFIWFETEADLSNGGEWPTENRNRCYTGNTWYDGKTRAWWAAPMGTKPCESV